MSGGVVACPCGEVYELRVTIGQGFLTPYVDNGAHIGGALGGALLARRLPPLVLEPMPPHHAARLRRWLWVVGALLAYTALGWLWR